MVAFSPIYFYTMTISLVIFKCISIYFLLLIFLLVSGVQNSAIVINKILKDETELVVI